MWPPGTTSPCCPPLNTVQLLGMFWYTCSSRFQIEDFIPAGKHNSGSGEIKANCKTMFFFYDYYHLHSTVFVLRCKSLPPPENQAPGTLLLQVCFCGINAIVSEKFFVVLYKTKTGKRARRFVFEPLCTTT